MDVDVDELYDPVSSKTVRTTIAVTSAMLGGETFRCSAVNVIDGVERVTTKRIRVDVFKIAGRSSPVFESEFCQTYCEATLQVRVYTVFSFFVFKFENEKLIMNSFFFFRLFSNSRTKN